MKRLVIVGILLALALPANADRGRMRRGGGALVTADHSTAGSTGGTPESPNCTKYASAGVGAGHAGTVGDPYRITDFLALGTSARGEVLCLNDGTYQGADHMIVPTSGISGLVNSRIVIRALHDGLAVLDGQFVRQPVSLNNNSYWTIQGINAKNGATSVYRVDNGSLGVILRRVIGWDTNFTDAVNIFLNRVSGGTSLATATLVEDSAFFGPSTITCHNISTGWVNYNRVWCRNEGSSSNTAGKESFNLDYDFPHASCHNCLATWLETGYPNTFRVTDRTTTGTIAAGSGACTGPTGSVCAVAAAAANPACASLVGVVSAPNCYAGGVMRSRGGSNVSVLHTHILGSLVYLPSGVTYGGDNALLYMQNGNLGISDRHVKHTYTYHPTGLTNKAGTANTSLRGFVGNTDDSNSEWVNITSVTAQPDTLASPGWTTTNAVHATTIAGLPVNAQNPWTNTGAGANLCKRWENNALTTIPLWPWPMNQRIIDATTAAGSYNGPCLECTGGRAARAPVDITATVEALFGTIPAECRS